MVIVMTSKWDTFVWYPHSHSKRIWPHLVAPQHRVNSDQTANFLFEYRGPYPWYWGTSLWRLSYIGIFFYYNFFPKIKVKFSLKRIFFFSRFSRYFLRIWFSSCRNLFNASLIFCTFERNSLWKDFRLPISFRVCYNNFLAAFFFFVVSGHFKTKRLSHHFLKRKKKISTS